MDDNLIFLVGTLVPTLVGAIGLFSGLYTYKESQLLKRKDIILPLIDQFDNSEDLFLAKAILDDFTSNVPPYGTKNKILEGLRHLDKDELEFYNKCNLKKILRYHLDTGVEQVTDIRERAVRRSFDSMIIFFFKLQYLYRIGLLKENELYYFKYYMKLAFPDVWLGSKENPIWNYSEKYKLELDMDFVNVVRCLDMDFVKVVKDRRRCINDKNKILKVFKL